MFFGLFGGERKRNADLIAAASAGNVAKVKKLLAKETNINATDPKSGDTALIAAAAAGKVDDLTSLLEKKANLDIQDNNGQTALFLAVTPGPSALAMVESLVKAGANMRLGPTSGDNAGATPLMLAIYMDAIPIVRTLLAGST